MISFFYKNGSRTISLVTIFFLLLLIGGGAFPVQAATTPAPTGLPAADVPPNINDLSAGGTQNGWACASTLIPRQGTYGCTNPNKDKATCSVIAPQAPNAFNGDVPIDPLASGGQTSCTVTYPDGYSSIIGEALGGAAITNRNPQGQVITPATSAGVPTLTDTPQAAAQNAAAAQVQAVQNTASSVAECVTSGIGGALSCVVSLVAYLMFQLAATMLGFVGLLFNWVVTVTVFEFGIYFANSSGMLIAWGILRDIGNIVLLFGFILMGIMMILDLDNFNVRKALPRLLIFAVLLNFSLFATEAVVDVANSLSAAFYAAAGDAGSCTGNNALTSSTCIGQGISGTILTATGLSTIWNDGSPTIQKFNSADGALVLVMEAIFVSIAAIVLLAGAIMLFIRAITLAFLLVISPLGFAGMAIPPLQKQAMQWWNKLISEAFFAPIFLLLIFVALKLTSILQPQGGNISFGDAIASPNSGNFGIFFLFIMIFGFLIASLVVAKNMSATGANIAISTSGKAFGAATFGVAGFAGRRVIGGTSSGIAQGLRSTKFGQSEFGRGFVKVFDAGAHASYDARTTGAAKALGKNKLLGVNLGEPSKTAKGGYHAIEEKAIKDRTDYAKSLEMSDAEEKEAARLKKEKGTIDKNWNAKQKTLDAEVTKIEKDNKDAPGKLQDLQTQRDAVRAEFSEAIRSGDPVKQAEAQKKGAALDTQINALTASMASGASNLKKAQDERTNAEKAYNAAVKANTDAIAANDPRQRYAKSLEGGLFGTGIHAYPVLSVGGHASERAAKKIKTGATKSDIKRALDTINDTLEKEEKTHEEERAEDKREEANAPQDNANAGGTDHSDAHGGGEHTTH